MDNLRQVGCRFTIRSESYKALVDDLLAFMPEWDDTPQKQARSLLKRALEHVRLTQALTVLFRLGHCEPLFKGAKTAIGSILYDETAVLREGAYPVNLQDFMATIAPHVDAGSYIEFVGQAGHFRYKFTGSAVGIVEPTLVYAEGYEYAPLKPPREVRAARKRREGVKS
jgi:hypothetical protein